MSTVPTLSVYKGASRITVNVADVPAFERDGWSRDVPGSKPAVGPEEPAKPVNPPRKIRRELDL